MENTQTNQESLTTKKEMLIDEKSKIYLSEIRKWTMFLSILGFIFIGLIVLIGLIMVMAGSLFGSYLGGMERVLIFFVYLVIGGLYFFPIYYLLKFSVNMRKALDSSEQNDLTSAFEFLKSHYKFIGILTIVVIGLYVLIGVIAAIAGLASMI